MEKGRHSVVFVKSLPTPRLQRQNGGIVHVILQWNANNIVTVSP